MSAEFGTEFRLDARLATGEESELYRAHQPRLRRDIALRLYPVGADQAWVAARIAREVQALTRLPVACIPRLLGAGVTDQRPWLALELVDGTRLGEDSRWTHATPRQRIERLAQVAEAVAALHARGVRHGRLGEERILLDAAGRVKIVGLSEAAIDVDVRGDVADLARLVVDDRGHLRRGRLPARADLIAVLQLARVGGYAQASEFADELRRWLRHEPVRARSRGFAGRLLLAARRERRVLCAAGGVAAMLLVARALAQVAAEREHTAARASRRWTNEARGLSAIRDLQQLRAEADLLWPAEPSREPQLLDWLARARRAGEAARATLAARLLPGEMEEAFADGAEARWIEDQFAQLATELAQLGGEQGDDGVVDQISARLARARSADAALAGVDAEAWAASRARQAAPNGPYQGRPAPAQVGLVPLGVDAESGFELFAVASTGALPTPEPATARIRPRAGDAVVLLLVPAGVHQFGVQSDDPNAPLFDPHPPAVPRRAPRSCALPAFFIGKFELTQDQYVRMGGGQSYYFPGWRWAPDRAVSELHPAENMSADEAGPCLARAGLRLPTPAEWEAAARAGSTTRWWPGPTELDLAGAGNLDAEAGERVMPSFAAHAADDFPLHAPVGSFRANPWGLHDVHGNVAEFVRESAGTLAPGTDPGDPGVMGGWFMSPPGLAACWIVRPVRPGDRAAGTGLRVARDIR